MLISRGTIAQSKGQHFALICAVSGIKHSIFLRSWVHADPVKGGSNVKLGKDLGLRRTGQQLVYAGNQIQILAGKVVKLLIVHADL